MILINTYYNVINTINKSINLSHIYIGHIILNTTELHAIYEQFSAYNVYSWSNVRRLQVTLG